MAMPNRPAWFAQSRNTPTAELSLDVIEDVVASALESKRFRPPLLPEVAIRLSRLVEDPNSDLVQAESVVTSDPNVAARVIAVANSAAFRTRSPITSLRIAIGRLGLVGVRDVAFRVVAAGRVFRVPAYSSRMEELFEAAQAAATLTVAAAAARGTPSQAAFLCGLLHDMGEATVLGIIADVCKTKHARLPSVEEVTPIIERMHASFGALICSEWQLPEVAVDAVAYHHDLGSSSREDSLAPAVAMADLLLRHIGVGVPWQPVTKADMPLIQAAGLSPERVGPLLRQAEALAAAKQPQEDA